MNTPREPDTVKLTFTLEGVTYEIDARIDQHATHNVFRIDNRDAFWGPYDSAVPLSMRVKPAQRLHLSLELDLVPHEQGGDIGRVRLPSTEPDEQPADH